MDLPPSPPLLPEPGPPAGPPPADTATADAVVAAPQPGRTRDRVGVALAVLATLALLVGSVAWWARTTLYDTATVTAKADEIVARPEVQDAATALLVERVVRPALAQGYDAIPLLGGSIVEGLVGDRIEQLATEAVQRAVASQPAHDVTVRLVTAIQVQLTTGSDTVAFQPSELAAILAPSLSTNRIVSGILAFADERHCCEVVLADRADLPFVWQHVEAIQTAGILLPLAAGVLAVAALLVSVRRRRTAVVLAIGVLLVGLLTLVALWIGATFGVESIGSPSDPANSLVRRAAATIYEISRRELVTQGWTLLAVGALATTGLTTWTILRPRPGTAPTTA